MKPTAKQLAYLRALAQRTGQTFTWPTTASQASQQIARLKAAQPTPAADRVRELRTVQRDMATRRGDGARVVAGETTGYGSSARWTHHADQPEAGR